MGPGHGGSCGENLQSYGLFDDGRRSYAIGVGQAQRSAVGLIGGVGPIALILDLKDLAREGPPEPAPRCRCIF